MKGRENSDPAHPEYTLSKYHCMLNRRNPYFRK
jgi:hypothetical protein